jgi:hypothetical protein
MNVERSGKLLEAAASTPTRMDLHSERITFSSVSCESTPVATSTSSSRRLVFHSWSRPRSAPRSTTTTRKRELRRSKAVPIRMPSVPPSTTTSKSLGFVCRASGCRQQVMTSSGGPTAADPVCWRRFQDASAAWSPRRAGAACTRPRNDSRGSAGSPVPVLVLQQHTGSGRCATGGLPGKAGVVPQKRPFRLLCSVGTANMSAERLEFPALRMHQLRPACQHRTSGLSRLRTLQAPATSLLQNCCV